MYILSQIPSTVDKCILVFAETVTNHTRDLPVRHYNEATYMYIKKWPLLNVPARNIMHAPCIQHATSMHFSVPLVLHVQVVCEVHVSCNMHVHSERDTHVICMQWSCAMLYECPRGGQKRFKCCIKYIADNCILLLGFWFHVTLNGGNTLLKKRWGLLGLIKYSDRTSRKHHDNVLSFVKALDFWGEISK